MNMYMPAAKDVEVARGPLCEGEPFLAVSVTGTKGTLSFRTGWQECGIPGYPTLSVTACVALTSLVSDC